MEIPAGVGDKSETYVAMYARKPFLDHWETAGHFETMAEAEGMVLIVKARYKTAKFRIEHRVTETVAVVDPA